MVAVVLLVRQAMRPDWKNLALGALMVVLLGLTQSRSGILAWIAFALFTLRWVRPARLLTGALAIGALLPLTHFLKVLRGILLKGVGVPELWREMVILLVFAAALIALAVRRFQKTLD